MIFRQYTPLHIYPLNFTFIFHLWNFFSLKIRICFVKQEVNPAQHPTDILYHTTTFLSK